MADTPKWGSYSFADGLKIPEVKTLKELARRSEDDLLHVVSILLNSGSEEAAYLAEEIFDANA